MIAQSEIIIYTTRDVVQCTRNYIYIVNIPLSQIQFNLNSIITTETFMDYFHGDNKTPMYIDRGNQGKPYLTDNLSKV